MTESQLLKNTSRTIWILFALVAPSCAQCNSFRPCAGDPRILPSSPSDAIQGPQYYRSDDVSTGVPPFQAPLASSNTSPQQIPSFSFGMRLFDLMARTTTNQNLVYSPAALETLLTFIFSFAEGKLAHELAELLRLPNNRPQVARSYHNLTNGPAGGDANNTLIVANKLYHSPQYGSVNQNIRQLAETAFASEIEPLDFQAPFKAAEEINAWVAAKTRHLIKGIVEPASLSANTAAVLVSSLYFKSDWLAKFSSYDTEKKPFYISRQHQVPVDMMYTEDVFLYGELQDLGAQVLVMPYVLQGFEMIVFLPNDVEGLSEVENRVARTNLLSLNERLQRAEVQVQLPKFQVQMDVDMVQPLKQLGLNSLFNDDAAIKLFQGASRPLRVDQIKHKTFVNVNERGTEASSATYVKLVPLSIPVRMKHFHVDHPFLFLIRNGPMVYFMGHVRQV